VVYLTVGIEPDEDRLELLLSQVRGKDITELIAAGREKLASVPAGGGAVAVAAAPVGGAAAGGAAAEPAKEEKKVEEKEESDDVRFGSLSYFCISNVDYIELAWYGILHSLTFCRTWVSASSTKQVQLLDEIVQVSTRSSTFVPYLVIS